MSNEIIVGLDIGTTKIACFIGQVGENGKIKILGWGKTTSIGVQHGEVKNIIDTAADIRRAVDEASEKANYDVTEVYVNATCLVDPAIGEAGDVDTAIINLKFEN